MKTLSAFDFFDRVYCIHLPNAERRSAIEAEFSRVGLVGAQFLHATPPKRPFAMSNMRRSPAVEFGIVLSHIKAIAHAIADGAERPLFLEDDVVFSENADSTLETALKDLPDSWDVLYLGGHPRGPAKMVGDALVSISNFSFGEAYSIRGPSLIRFFDYWADRIGQRDAMIDFIIGEFAGANEGFCVYPLLTRQRAVASHVSGKVEDKQKLLAKGWDKNLSIR